jgi:hypothetical protein
MRGVLTLSTGMRVSPEPEAIELLRRYNVALNYAINRILRLDLKKIGEVHNALYRELREWFGLLSRTAVDCYRDALANAKDGGTILGKGGDQGLRSYLCFYIKAWDTG